MAPGRSATLPRRDVLLLHRRHAGRVRAVLYWLGLDLEALDGAVLRTFLLAADLPAPPSRAALGRLAFRVAARPAAPPPRRRVVAPRLPPAADALARFLADHPGPLPRAVFVLAEFTGTGPDHLAAELRDPALAPTLRDALLELRAAFVADPEVARHGGPGPVLEASLAPFLDDDAWQARHAAVLASRLAPARPDLGELLRHPAAIIGLGCLAALLLVGLARRHPAPLRVVAVQEPQHAPAPTLRLFPPVPTAMSPAPGPMRKVVKARSAPRPSARAAALAEREQLAKARDPGAVIVELEMLGAARKSIAHNPHQALAYLDQHARDFPGSQLVDQRAEVRVRALCALGRAAEARTEAARRNTPKVQAALSESCR
jgi:hypothetical protein